ncbi:tetratricopeptide repeat protein [Jiella avicenniae]|uniref:Sel1 repeat-containing protein n=1 Tax=Jiella avicenniae TaxID=2907202 RepID=A0A9X1NWS4_9HYPH|nr:tetratricopeptide repeat protein [Jiella avicenniae]MCE7026942.1 hypothetical protein [Jiella avicenniae]
MTVTYRSRRLALLAGVAFLVAAPADADQLLAQAAADCREAKDHFEIARQIDTPEAYQAHIDAFGACPYASFARILQGQSEARAGRSGDGAAGASAVGTGAESPAPQLSQQPAAPMAPDDAETPPPAAAEAPLPAAPMQAGTAPEPQPQAREPAAPSVARDPFSGAGGTSAGSDADPRPVPIPAPDVAAPAAPSAPADAGDVAAPQAPTVTPQVPTDEAKLLADTMVDRLNALQGASSQSGPRFRYDSAVLDQGDLFVTNLRLTKDDGQPNWSGFVAPSTVVLKPKLEADGTLTANSIFMTKSSIRATERNGPNDRVATIASISILDPRLTAVGATPASDSLGPADLRGIDIRSVTGFDPTGELLTIAAIQLTTNGVSDGLPQSATFSIKNLAFTPEQMARITETSVGDFEGLGRDFFDFTLTTMMQRDTAAQNLKLTEVVEIGREGSLTVSTALGNFSPADVRALVSAGNPAALVGLGTSLEEAEVNFVNTSLVDKVLEIAAKGQNIDPPLFRAAIPTAARDAILGSTGNTTLAENAADALRAFLSDPRSLRLSIKPSGPVPLVGTAFALAGAADPLQQMALLSPTVSVNGGEPVPLLGPAPAAPSAEPVPSPVTPGGTEDLTPPAEDRPDAQVPVDPLPLVPSPDGVPAGPPPALATPGDPAAPRPGAATASVLAECDRLAADSDDPTKPAEIAGVKAPADIDVTKAVPACEAAHRLAPGDARVTFQLGRSYQAAGRDDEAARLYREAAEAGQAVAQYELALAFYDGRGVAPDPRQAVDWLEKSSGQGNGFARYFLGIEKVNGTTIPQDYAEAYALFQDAAAFGVPEALVELGKMAYSGQGVDEDYAKAFDFYRQAAEKDVPGGHFYVGFMDAFGIGAPGATPLDAAKSMMTGLSQGYADAEELIVTGGGKIFETPVRQAIQDYLRAEGVYRGRSDGVFGPATLSAIDAWRKAGQRG